MTRTTDMSSASATPAAAGQQESLSTRLAHAALRMRFDTLPADVVMHAKRLISDTVMVSWAGAVNPSTQAIANVYRQMGGEPEATIWGAAPSVAPSLTPVRHRLPRANAAFVNALHASTLDYDSLNGSVHADAVCLPAAAAIAEHRNASGQDLIAAFVAGSEIVGRLALARSAHQKGWSPTGIYAAVGAAVAAGKLLNLSHTEMTHAIGLSVIQAAGTQQSNVERTLGKRLQPAFAARNGVTAALLAEAGATAPVLAFEGRFGFHTLYEGGNVDQVMHGIGQHFAFSATAIKRYPVCACSHAALSACEQAVRASGLRRDDVRAALVGLTVTITPFMARLVGAPFQAGGDPDVSAQFSIQYALATLLMHGRVGMDALRPERVRDPAIAELIERIEVRVDDSESGELTPARVDLQLRDGTRWSARTDVFPGASSGTAAGPAQKEKFADCIAFACTSTPENGDQSHSTQAMLSEWMAAIDRLSRDDNAEPHVPGFATVFDGPFARRVEHAFTGADEAGTVCSPDTHHPKDTSLKVMS